MIIIQFDNNGKIIRKPRSILRIIIGKNIPIENRQTSIRTEIKISLGILSDKIDRIRSQSILLIIDQLPEISVKSKSVKTARQ